LYDEAAEFVEHSDEGAAVWLACQLNCAQANINLKQYPQASERAGKVLGKDASNVKALFRRGVARNHMSLPDEALVDLNTALELGKILTLTLALTLTLIPTLSLPLH